MNDFNLEDAEYIDSVIKTATALPKRLQKIGASEVEWWEGKPGDAVIMASGGTLADRVFAESIVKDQLAPFGYKRATFHFADVGGLQWEGEMPESLEEYYKNFNPQEQPDDEAEAISIRPENQENAVNQKARGQGIERTKDLWNNLIEKAVRLINSGSVQIGRNGYNVITAHVYGDHGQYNVEIGRDDPDSQDVTSWTCECKWDQYAWQRTRQWKKYEGRPCSHVLATYWLANMTPIDEDENKELVIRKKVPKEQLGQPTPAQPAPMGVGTSPFMEGPGTETGQIPTEIKGPRGLYQMNPPGPQEEEVSKRFLQPRGLGEGQEPRPFVPEPEKANSIIPESPVERQQRELEQQELRRQQVSVPGKSQPTPANPMQMMHTWSSVKNSAETPGWYRYHGLDKKNDVYRKNDTVILKNDVMGQSEGPGGGGYQDVPAGSVVTVESVTQIPGLGDSIEVTFELEGGANTPYRVRCWIEPKDIQAGTSKEDIADPIIGDSKWEDIPEMPPSE